MKTGQVIGDPQSILDFAIIGHGKCGTTTLQHWLMNHPEVMVPEKEILELSMAEKNPAATLIFRLYKEFLGAGRVKLGTFLSSHTGH